MARGKQTCKILKEIRRQIAEANGIEFVTSECKYKGDCRGTCPRCEDELRYLEQQIAALSLAGKSVALAGISAGMIVMSGCGSKLSNVPTDVVLGVEDTQHTEIVANKSTIQMIENVDSCNNAVFKEVNRSDNSTITDFGENGDVFEILQGETLHVDEPESKSSRIYSSAERMPEYPGGERALLKFINKNLTYPEDTREYPTSKVVVRFYIDTLGHVCAPRILRGTNPAFDNEALRVINLIHDFSPAELGGKKVNVWYTLPIIFKRPDDEPIL